MRHLCGIQVYQGEKYTEKLKFAGLPDETLPTVRSSSFQASCMMR